MMTHLPEPVSDRDIMDMFAFADKNKDGRISGNNLFFSFSVLTTTAGDDNPGESAGGPKYQELQPSYTDVSFITCIVYIKTEP